MRLQSIDEASDLLTLEEHESASDRVTLQVPVERAPTGLPATTLRLRAALERAERGLCARGMDAAAASQRMQRLAAALPALEALDHDVRTLVILADESEVACATTTATLPERVTVASHFALRPLLRALRRERRFRVVAASLQRVATYAGDPHGLTPIEVPGLPDHLEEALGEQIVGGVLSFHSDRPVPGRANAPVFHGHGGANAGRSLDRERWLRIVAGALRDAWGNDAVPIVIAAEVRTASELRRRLGLPHVIDGEVGGPADEGTPSELHARAWPLVCEAWAAERRALAEEFERSRAHGKSAQDIDEIVRLAVAGRVRRLWVEERAAIPGRIDEAAGDRVAIRDRGEDALDALVSLVLRRRGEICVTDDGATPDGSACCAELR